MCKLVFLFPGSYRTLIDLILNYITWHLLFFFLNFAPAVGLYWICLETVFPLQIELVLSCHQVQKSSMSTTYLVLIWAQISTCLCFPAAFIFQVLSQKAVSQLKAGFFKRGLCCHSFPTLCTITPRHTRCWSSGHFLFARRSKCFQGTWKFILQMSPGDLIPSHWHFQMNLNGTLL